MLRRNFLASAAALLAMPAVNMTERLLGPKVVRTSEMRIGKPVHNAHVIIDGDMEGLILQNCSFEFAVRAPVWRAKRCVFTDCEVIDGKHYSGWIEVVGCHFHRSSKPLEIVGWNRPCLVA